MNLKAIWTKYTTWYQITFMPFCRSASLRPTRCVRILCRSGRPGRTRGDGLSHHKPLQLCVWNLQEHPRVSLRHARQRHGLSQGTHLRWIVCSIQVLPQSKPFGQYPFSQSNCLQEVTERFLPRFGFRCATSKGGQMESPVMNTPLVMASKGQERLFPGEANLRPAFQPGASLKINYWGQILLSFTRGKIKETFLSNSTNGQPSAANGCR